MPKGFKTKNGYATAVDRGGLNYRQIAEKMNAAGIKMNHSTARNVFLSALKKIATPICETLSVDQDPDDLSRNPDFQSSIAQIVADIYSEQDI